MAHDATNHGITGDTWRKSRVARHWVPVAVFACSFLFLIATMIRSVNPYDEGLILVGSTRVLSGDVPYRDFYTVYGPAQVYVLAALFKIFGPSVLVERLYDLLIRAGTVLVIYLIIDGAWSRGTAIFLAALTCMWLSFFQNYGYPVFPCLLFALLSLYFLIPVYQGRREIGPLLASGVCVGITVLFRHDVGIATAVGGAFTLGLFNLTQELNPSKKIRAALRSVLIYMGGIALAVIPVLSLLIAAGGAHDMLVDLVLFPAKCYVRMRSLPFPSVAEMVHDFMHPRYGYADKLPADYLPIVGVLLGAASVLVIAKNKRYATSVEGQAPGSQRLWILVQMTVFSFLFFFKGWVRPNATEMALSIVPSLVIITVCQTELRFGAAKILSGIGIACLLLTSWPPLRNALNHPLNLVWGAAGAVPSNGSFGVARSESHGAAPSANGSCFPPAGFERIRCFSIPQGQFDAIPFIQEHTAENEPIFVGNNRHDKIVYQDVLFYFAAKRPPPATKWYQFEPGLQTTSEIQSEMVADLQKTHPRYVVLSSRWDDVKEPNDSALSSGVKLLDNYIDAHYRAVASFGKISILERYR